MTKWINKDHQWLLTSQKERVRHYVPPTTNIYLYMMYVAPQHTQRKNKSLHHLFKPLY